MGLQTNHNHALNGYRFFPCSIYPILYLQCYVLKCPWDSLFPKITLTHFSFFSYKKVHLNPWILYINPLKSKKNMYQQPCPVGFNRSSLFWPYIFSSPPQRVVVPQALASQWEGSCMVEGQHLGKCSRGSRTDLRRHDSTSFIDEMVGIGVCFRVGSIKKT